MIIISVLCCVGRNLSEMGSTLYFEPYQGDKTVAGHIVYSIVKYMELYSRIYHCLTIISRLTVLYNYPLDLEC